jgi:hypothetical protein
MPYKSDAQRRAFHAMLARGEIDKATVDEFDASSEGMALPERVKVKKKAVAKKVGKKSKKKVKV